MPPVETLSVPGTLRGVRQAVDAFERFGHGQALAAESVWPFLVALDEILSNIVRHGQAGPDRPIDLRFSCDAGVIEVEVIDASVPFDPLSAPAPDTAGLLDERRPGGLGVALARQLMDGARYERRGHRNHFVMTRRV